jgi:hypothetical protein
MDDPEQANHSGTEHRLENARWIWTRVFGSSGEHPSAEDLDAALDEYQRGSSVYW